MKWEEFGDKSTSMAWSTEKDIRLAIVHSIQKSASKFVELYDELIDQMPNSAERVTIEAEKVAD